MCLNSVIDNHVQWLKSVTEKLNSNSWIDQKDREKEKNRKFRRFLFPFYFLFKLDYIIVIFFVFSFFPCFRYYSTSNRKRRRHDEQKNKIRLSFFYLINFSLSHVRCITTLKKAKYYDFTCISIFETIPFAYDFSPRILLLSPIVITFNSPTSQ